MPDKSWKAFERRMAKALGGRRRGADTRSGERGGKSDIIHATLAPECKLLSRPTWGELQDAVAQATRNAEEHRTPVALVKKKGDEDRKTLVVMSLPEFLVLFGTSPKEVF